MGRIGLFVNTEEPYCRILGDSFADEIRDYLSFDVVWVTGFRELLKVDYVVVCGTSSVNRFSKLLLMWTMVLKRPLYLYSVLPSEIHNPKILKYAKMVIVEEEKGLKDGYYYFPDSILLCDYIPLKNVNRIFKKEKLVSRRGNLGIMYVDLIQEELERLARALELIIEDMDLNIILLDFGYKSALEDLIGMIRYTANTRRIDTRKYTSYEIMGILNRMDIILTGRRQGVLLGLGAERPVMGLVNNMYKGELIKGTTEEEILLNPGELTIEALYTRIKIGWVHREAIKSQLQETVSRLREAARNGIRLIAKSGKR